jgi:hypothetical protein
MALIPIYCSNERCRHFGFVSVEMLPRVLTCSCCGVQSMHASPPVSAKYKFAISECRQSTAWEREQWPSAAA